MKTRLLPVFVIAALSLVGCSSTQSDGYFNQKYDLSRVQRVAIVDGNNPTFKPETRQALIDAFMLDFLRKGWNTVERSNIQAAVNEIDFQNKDFTSQTDRQKLGHILNVQALTVINIQSAGDDIAISAKMFDVETGEVIWLSTGSGNVNSTTSMLVGAVIGTAVGAAVGHNMGDNASTGAIAGAVVGGLAGRSMSETQTDNAKLMIAQMCETLPIR